MNFYEYEPEELATGGGLWVARPGEVVYPIWQLWRQAPWLDNRVAVAAGRVGHCLCRTHVLGHSVGRRDCHDGLRWHLRLVRADDGGTAWPFGLGGVVERWHREMSKEVMKCYEPESWREHQRNGTLNRVSYCLVS